MRELGHFPVRNEMRLKSRQDKTFPNEKTFGSHHLLVGRIRRFCEGRPEYSDILAMCPQLETSSDSGTLLDPETDMGFVYLLKSGRYYKIGRTNWPVAASVNYRFYFQKRPTSYIESKLMTQRGSKPIGTRDSRRSTATANGSS